MQKQEILNNETARSESMSLAQRFLLAVVQIEVFGREIGIAITPTDSNLPLFKALPLEEQKRAVQKIEQSFEIFASVVMENKDLGNAFSLVWMACSRLGLRPPSDFFDKISDEDVVQVYSQEGIHRFSNFKFFEKCSYTLEQIYTLPWHLLWMRGAKDTAFLNDCAMKVMDPTQKQTLVFNSPAHRIHEVSSVFKYESEYQLKCAAPLFDRETGFRNGFIVCERARVLTVHTPRDEERLLLDFEKPREVTNLRSLS